MAKIKRKNITFLTNTESYFSEFEKQLKALESDQVDKIAKAALNEAIELPAEDMLKEFTEVHPGTGATAADFKVTKARKENKGLGYYTKAEYQRRGTKKRGFVALFFDYGVPHFRSPESKGSEGFISRSFGTDGKHPQRREEIDNILKKHIQAGLEEVQKELANKAKKD